MIALDLQTFEQKAEGSNVTGVIYLELKDEVFPKEGWSDLPVTILSWWIEALLQLDVPTRCYVKWLFMDGPHVVTLTKVTSAPSVTAVEFEYLVDSLLEASGRVVAHCDQHKLFSRDLETLRQDVQRLKANRTVQRTGASRLAQIEIRASSAADSRR